VVQWHLNGGDRIAVHRLPTPVLKRFRPVVFEGDRAMRKFLMLLAVGVLCSSLGLLRADDSGKTITIKGDGLCAKCALKDKDAKKCRNAVIVTKDGKKITYYLSGKLSDEVHKSMGFCSATKDEPVKVEVTGTCKKDGDKLVLTPTEKIKKVD
jgi:Family of unknown function (DUF6370)